MCEFLRSYRPVVGVRPPEAIPPNALDTESLGNMPGVSEPPSGKTWSTCWICSIEARSKTILKLWYEGIVADAMPLLTNGEVCS